MSVPFVSGFPARAAASLVGLTGRVMKITGTNTTDRKPTVTIVAAAGYINGGEKPVGFLAEGKASGAAVDIVCDSEYIDAVAGDTITAGTHYELSYNNVGKLIPATVGMWVVAHMIGYQSVVADDRVRVLAVKPYRFAAQASSDKIGRAHV